MRAGAAADPGPLRTNGSVSEFGRRSPAGGERESSAIPAPSGALAQLNWGLFGPGRQDQETVESDPAADHAPAPTGGAASEDPRLRVQAASRHHPLCRRIEVRSC
jgi:hypothetical protein